MKKLLAAVLAAAMTLSMGVVSFATADDVPEPAYYTLNFENLEARSYGYGVILTVDGLKFELEEPIGTATIDDANLAKLFNDEIDSTEEYQISVADGSTVLTINRLINGKMKNPPASVNNYTLKYTNSASSNVETNGSVDYSVDFTNGTIGELYTANDDANFALSQFVFCDKNGNPAAYVESGKENDQDGVRSGEKIYFVFRSMALTDEDAFKVKISKGENAKQVSSIKLLEKKFNNGLVPLLDPDVENTDFAGERISVVEVALKEIYTDDEFKIDFDMTFTAKENMVITYTGWDTDLYDLTVTDGEKFKIDSTGKFWMKNSVDETDSTDYEGGRKGYVIKPTKNEDNDYTWNNENDDIALLEFEADDDVVKVYAKLSTVWDNQDYAEYFADSDAFFYNFVSNPVISSTSRALLTIYNPFIDEDDELSVDADEIKVYEVVDGELVDSKMTLGENEDGDSVFTLKTRQLGTYIIAGPKGAGVEEAPTAVPTGLVLPSRG